MPAKLTRDGAGLVTIGLLTIVIIEVTALLRGETFRLWLFAQPLLTVPAALGAAALPRRRLALVLGLMIVLIAVMRANMWFIEPG